MNPANSQIWAPLLFWQHLQGPWQRLHKEVTAKRCLTRGHSCWVGPEQPPTFSPHSSGIMMSAGCAADTTRHWDSERKNTKQKWWSVVGPLWRHQQSQRKWPQQVFWTMDLEFVISQTGKSKYLWKEKVRWGSRRQTQLIVTGWKGCSKCTMQTDKTYHFYSN